MSKALISRLPLPEPYQVVSREESLLKTWQAVNDWYTFVVEAADKGTRSTRLAVMAPHIRLGLNYLSVRMVKAYKDAGSPQQKENPDLVGAFVSVQMASQEVQKNELFMQGLDVTTTAFASALDAASEMFDRMFPREARNTKSPQSQAVVDLGELRVCSQFYENLDRYNRYVRAKKLPQQVRFDTRDLGAQILHLEAEIARREARLDKGRKLDQHDDDDDEAKPPSKKAREVSIQPKNLGLANEPARPDKGSQNLGPSDGTVQPEQSAQAKNAIMRTLAFDVSESTILSFQDAKVVSRGAGLPTLKDFAELVSGDWLSDNVINPHLALLCDLKNRQPGNDPVSKSAPEWHAWPSYLYLKTSEGAELPRLWPPQGYTKAEFGETHHHLFPIHLDGNHWGLAHLSWGGAKWSLDWYSGLPGYLARFRAQWADIEKYLKRVWGFKCDQNLIINEPQQQRQGNASDCGVFVLCEARCLIMGWPVTTFGQEDMNSMRRRICFELELDRIGAS